MKKLAQVPYETAYPRVEILPSSRNWWAKLKGTAAECIHTRDECAWIAALLPDILVKGGDWPGNQIVGREEVEAAGGKVVQVDVVPGYSTTEILKKIRG